MHIGSEALVRARIPAFRGRDERNNRLVLETLALQGPLIKYDIFKVLKMRNVKHYPTVSRRVDNLRKRGYLGVAGKKVITIGKKKEESSTYALTWKGFIASLTIEGVAKETPRILSINPLLKIPFPKEMVLNVLNELLTPVETKILVHALLEGFLRAIPRDIESIEQEKYIAYIVPALVETPEIRKRFEKKDFSKLSKIPGFLELLADLVDSFEKQLMVSLNNVQTIKKELKNYIQTTQERKIRTLQHSAS